MSQLWLLKDSLKSRVSFNPFYLAGRHLLMAPYVLIKNLNLLLLRNYYFLVTGMFQKGLFGWSMVLNSFLI